MKEPLPHSPAQAMAAESPGDNNFPEPTLPRVSLPWRKMVFFILLAIGIHLGLISFFGTNTQIIPRPVSNVPRLELAGEADPLIALDNPTLFALPNPQDFASPIWLKVPAVTGPSFSWSEPPRWLTLDAANPGAAFQEFSPPDTVSEVRLDAKPPPQTTLPFISLGGALPSGSSLKILGSLARRGLASPVTLPSLPDNNVIPPSKVQVLVDPTGTVLSTVLLPLTDSAEALERYDPADQTALDVARRLRFAPAANFTLGAIIFSWHTTPVPLDNGASGP